MTLQKTRDRHLIATGIKDISTIRVASNLVKYDTAGNLLWHRAGRIMHFGEHDLKQKPNGSYLFAGNVPVNQPGNFRDTYLQEFDENGDTTTTWAQTYPGPLHEYPTDMLLAEDGEVLIAGYAAVPHYITLRRTDSLGNTLWYKKYTTNDNMDGTRMIRNRNNNLVLLGSIIAPGVNQFHPYLLEVNLNGDSLHSKHLVVQDSLSTERTNRIFNNIIQTSDGGYVYGGVFPNNGYVAKLDSAFNLLWFYEMLPQQQVQGISHVTSKVIELQDSSLLFLSKDSAPIVTQFYITRLSQNGDSISTTALQSPICENMMPYQWQFLADSSIVICGWCMSNNQAYIGRWGNLNYPLPIGFVEDTTTVSAPEGLLGVKPFLGFAYPNPTESAVTLPYKLPARTKAASIQISELATGRLVKRLMLNPEVEQVKVSLQQVNSGMYSYTLFVEGTPVSTKKLVVIK